MRPKSKAFEKEFKSNSTADFFGALGLAQPKPDSFSYSRLEAANFCRSDEAKRWTVASLFSGCGGLDLGFKQVGFDLIYACDNDPAAVACYNYNVDDRAVVRDVSTPDFLRDIQQLGSCDVVLGGFPCQGFSKAGPKNANDGRNALYLQMREAVRCLSPQIFIAENVDGIEQNFNGQFVAIIREAFRFPDAEYEVEFQILDAQAYGAPQHRRRAFFVGRKKPLRGPFLWPMPTHTQQVRNGEFKVAAIDFAEKTLPPKTIGDAIGDITSLDATIPDHKVTYSWPGKYSHVFRKIGPGQKLCNVRHAESSVYTWEIPEVFSAITDRQRTILETISRNRRHKRYGNIPNGNPLSEDEVKNLTELEEVGPDIRELESKGYLKRVAGGYDLKGAMFCSGLFKRPLWNAPSPTVLTNFHNPRYFLHPEKDRPFSLRECARLQTFPDDFLFEAAGVDLVDGYRLVGNAVAPVVAKAFAVSVFEFLRNSDQAREPQMLMTGSA